MDFFDAIVVGTGGIGSAALYHLSKRGLNVLGLDQFPPAHSFGSSHGQTRIIRQAYFEHPDYVPLLKRSYKLWRQLEAETGKSLFHEVGLVEAGPSQGVLIPGVLASAQEHDVEVEKLERADAAAKYPFNFPTNLEVVFEPTGGYLLVEDCVRTHLEKAIQLGATWQQEKVVAWSSAPNSGDPKSVIVETEANRYQAQSLVICGGAWSADLLGTTGRLTGAKVKVNEESQEWPCPLQIMEKHQYWFAAPPITNHMPGFFFETDFGEFYGFPQIDDLGIKIAHHSGGQPHARPLQLPKKETDQADLDLVRRFAEEFLAFDIGNLIRHETCMYTMSPDAHFVVDRHPEHPNVVFTAGLSGHGFKFASVLGEAMADLSTQDRSSLPIDFLELKRFT